MVEDTVTEGMGLARRRVGVAMLILLALIILASNVKLLLADGTPITINPSSPTANVSFTVSGSGEFHFYVYAGSGCTGSIVFTGSISGPFNDFPVPGKPAGPYSANSDLEPCVDFTILPTTTSVATATGLGTATFSTSAGAFQSLTASAVGSVSPPPPSGLSFPDGLFSFTIVNLSPSQTITVTITLPSPLAAGNFVYYKFLSGTWNQYALASLDSTRTIITLTLTADGTGTVTDPGGPALTQPIPEYPLGLPILATLMIIAYGVVNRRTRETKFTLL